MYSTLSNYNSISFRVIANIPTYKQQNFVSKLIAIANHICFAEICNTKKFSTTPKKEVRRYCVFRICSVTLLQTY